MDNRVQIGSVLKRVNLARAAYGAFDLETLLGGEPHSASFCAIGRSLRSGVEDWLFVSIGSAHLRLWTLGKDPDAVAKLIMTAWGISDHRLRRPHDKSIFVTLPLPIAIREFVNQFDRGLLPEFRGAVSQEDMRRLNELVHAIPFRIGQRNSGSNPLMPRHLLSDIASRSPENICGSSSLAAYRS
jgi:hypothetical protein